MRKIKKKIVEVEKKRINIICTNDEQYAELKLYLENDYKVEQLSISLPIYQSQRNEDRQQPN